MKGNDTKKYSQHCHKHIHLVATIDSVLPIATNKNLRVDQFTKMSNEPDNGTTAQQRRDMLTHVILPRFLPQRISAHLHATELHLLHEIVKNLEDLSEMVPKQTVKLFQSLRRIHNEIELNADTISSEINKLRPGDSFAIFVRRQRWMFMIHAPPSNDESAASTESEEVILATFPGNVRPSEIYKPKSDISLNYPFNAMKVKFTKMLRSKAFAQQLCVLYSTPPYEMEKEAKSRDYVSNWLMTVLCNEESQKATSDEFPVITKKIRDEVLGDSENSYFRRSYTYMGIKALLQHNLTVQIGKESGKFLYKIVMMKYLIKLCGFYTSSQCSAMDIDLLYELIAKMARRIEKLKDLMCDPSDKDSNFMAFYQTTVEEAKNAIGGIRTKIDNQVKTMNATKVVLPPLTGLNVDESIVQRMPKLIEHMCKRAEVVAYQQKNQSNDKIDSYQRFVVNQYPNVSAINVKKDELGERIFWLELENMVLYEMEMDGQHYSVDELRTWFFAYSKFAKSKYIGNQLFISRMILVCLRIISILDRRATQAHPLLLKYQSGIDPQIIAQLLLATRKDMKIAYDLEQYFDQRNRNAPKTNPSLIGEKTVSAHSFSTNYAQQNEDMIAVRQKIVDTDKMNLEKIWSEHRQKAANLREKARQLSCKCNYSVYYYTCEKCRLEKEAKQIIQYEHLLPENLSMQYAIVMELRIPKEIACLRDALFEFTSVCNNKHENVDIKFKWNTNGSDILKHNKSNSARVWLGSKTKFEPKLVQIDDSFDSLNEIPPFHVGNTSDCVFYGDDDKTNEGKKILLTSFKDDVIKTACKFRTNGDYECLQWTLNGTNHSQNEVLSSQSDCPHNLSLAEYKNFGSLRADGHRLQLRTLYAMIETEALRFESESVLSIIMQTLWECGISGDATDIRESHIDFNDTEFSIEMIKLLKKFVSEQKSNWKHPFKMIMAILVAVRIFEINANVAVADEVVQFLNVVRFFLLEWIDQIGNAIHQIEKPDEEIERDLRRKLIYVGVAGALTFFVNFNHEHFERIFFVGDSDENVTGASLWLRYIITVKNNILMYTNDDTILPSNLRMFIRLTESIGVHLSRSITTIVKQNPATVHDLIRQQWTRAQDATFRSTRFHPTYPHILMVEAVLGTNLQIVSIDIIAGIFLVDGLPVCRLPLKIMQSKIYQWFFDNVAFEVQPDGQKNFSAVQKYNGHSYEFKVITTAAEEAESVVIIERTPDNIEKELIDYSIFQDDFPYLLVNDYSHWLNKAKNRIEFRKRTFGHTHFSKETTVVFEIDLQTKLLIHLETGRRMLDIGSDSYKNIVHQLTRLEHCNYIHILTNENTPKVAIVELVRMKLKFKVDTTSASTDTNQHYELESDEIKGMHVSRTQNVGTLYGLNHGLVLESSDDVQNRILLIPHGNIQSERTDSHVSVHIDTQSDLKTPSFFRYEVDTFCQQLKPKHYNVTSWFYLAYLHAVTSHGQSEELTEMTGTERAVQILQSAFAWSSEPYEDKAIEMLKEIAKLSPRRQFSENRQIVEWPEHIQPRAAQDCFVVIAKELFDESQRLHRLHFKDSAESFEIDTRIDLNKRDHRRCQQLYPNLNVLDKVIKRKELRTTFITPNQIGSNFSRKTQKVSILYHRQEYEVPSTLNLKSISKSHATSKVGGFLKGLVSRGLLSSLLNHNGYENLENAWISLYEAVRKQEFNAEQFALILTMYAHRCENIDLILSLQAIAMNRHAFENIDPPDVETYKIADGTYDATEVTSILEKNYEKPYSYYRSYDGKERQTHDNEYSQVLNEVTEQVTTRWPCDSVYLTCHSFSHINFEKANDEINEMLLSWNNNFRLEIFLDKVTECLKSLSASGRNLNYPDDMLVLDEAKIWSKYNINLDNFILGNLNTFDDDIIIEARSVFHMEVTASSTNKSASEWKTIVQKISNSDKTNHLINAGLFPRMIPSILLPKICQDAAVDTRLQNLIGAWAITIAKQQRDKRIELYSKRPDKQPDMDREIENEPHINWKPHERPEWLLFEIEQYLTIRRIQVEVANRMILPPPLKDANDAKHSVMQLNMGEGKTSVIVPILAAVLADGKQMCQIIVLKPLFKNNLNSLRQYLGGLLNRRIYTFPCRRDMKIDKSTISQISSTYQECMAEKGVILTLPEYILSFELKLYESIGKKDYELAQSIRSVQNINCKKVRNILDESDAILQPKYQLIYTLGAQSKPDGDELRWTIAQAILKRVPGHMNCLLAKYGKEKIEFDEKYVENGLVSGAPMVSYRDDMFTPCRILDEAIFEHLKSALIDDFLAGRFDIDFPEIVDAMKNDLRTLLTKKELDATAFQVIDGFSNKNEKDTIYILSGFLRFEVLKIALTKRWRVNYGVDVNGRRKLAIPFRAKDVAAEMTEYGHSDVAVCLTLLSYYYSGLTDDQLVKVFSLLENTPDSKAIYEKWMQTIAPQLIDPSVISYSGVNLDDPHQKDKLLFPLLRFNVYVIDFWLSNVVFPHELKIFEKKLTCTAWDLCSDRFEHLVTGFSGTNDTKNIIPLPIAQNDLPELERTNDKMREVLLREENQSYHALPASAGWMEIKKYLTERKIPVLLDSGAIIKIDNKKVAKEWLESVSKDQFDAAVYFNKDELQTIECNGTIVSYDCSVYRDNLSRCLVYLDDEHTRGVDLKFPLNTKACVTLSGDITRDKTVQSCMRMRQLGKTHSVSFLASFEADIRIRESKAEGQVTIDDVIKFIENNSERFVRENMSHWAAAGSNYVKKLIGHELFAKSMDENSMDNLYDWCVDNDFVELAEMYGEKKKTLLQEILKSKMNKLANNSRLTVETRQFVNDTKAKMIQKLEKYAPDLEKFVQSLDEETEKELENEKENEREVYRPGKYEPADPTFDERLLKLVSDGIRDYVITEMKADGTLMSIPESLSHTELYKSIENDVNAWGDHLLVTKDFKTVTKQTEMCDSFLRPVWWIAKIENAEVGGQHFVILLSRFECEQLKSTFQKSINAMLIMYRPRLSQLHGNLIEIDALHLTGKTVRDCKLDIDEGIQIGVYSGMMYFRQEAELKAYCEFLGLIVRPRTIEQEQAFNVGKIQPKGFVLPENRQYSQAISECVGKCRFQNNQVEFVVELIKARHELLPKVAHVAPILWRGIKPDLAKKDPR